MRYDFNEVIDRRSTNSIKWQRYGPQVLPLWVADMDFRAPEPIRAALQAVVQHGIFGYEHITRELRQLVASRMENLYQWKISPEAVVPTPGVIAGFTAAAHTVCSAGEGVLIQPPVYPPFLSLHAQAGLTAQQAGLRCVEQGHLIRYEIDWDVLQAGIHSAGARTAMFLLCNPHNPIGLEFSTGDLLRIADLCAKNDIILCSDEIHAELLLGKTRHTPVASLVQQPASRIITLVAPSKTFNIPGLFCAFAILPDEELRKRYEYTLQKLALHVNALGLTAARAAYSGDCDDWLQALRSSLTQNRDYLVKTIQDEFPGMRITNPDATYLAWLDCRPLIESGRIQGSAHKFFLHQAHVALNDGAEFGPGGEGFLRLNFGCPRRTLEEALQMMKAALA